MAWLRSLFDLQPGRNSWLGGLRLALAVSIPVALALIAGRPDVGLLIAIGAFFTANADLGFEGRITSYGQLGAAAIVPIATCLGMVFSGRTVLSLCLCFVLLAAGGLVAAAGPTAAAFGMFASFAYLIGLGLASGDASPILVAAAMFVGAGYALALSWLARRFDFEAFPPAPDLPAAHRDLTELKAEIFSWSPTTRRALALGIAGTIGLLVTTFVPQSSGAWLITAALIVLKPDLRSSIDAATARGLGTVIGALAAGIVAAMTSNQWVLLIAAFGVTWLAESIVDRSFGLFCVLITPLAVFLAEIVQPSGWSEAILRAADVAIGSLLGVAVAFVILPRSHEDNNPDSATVTR